MNVITVHLIRVDEDLDTAAATPPGMHARVELGHTDYLDINAEHQISYLTWAAASVQLVGTDPRVLTRLARAIVDYADDQAVTG